MWLGTAYITEIIISKMEALEQIAMQMTDNNSSINSGNVDNETQVRVYINGTSARPSKKRASSSSLFS